MNTDSLPQYFESLRSQFKLMRECPICEKEYGAEHIRVVAETNGSHVLHVTCPTCNGALIMFVEATEIGMGLVGLVSDLSFEDVYRFKYHEPLGMDELLDAYDIITTHHHSFVHTLITHSNKT